MLEIFFQHPWLVLVVLAVVHYAEFCLAHIGARAYQAQQIYRWEGSSETMPEFQSGMEALRKASPRQWLHAAGSWLWFGAMLYLFRYYLIPAIDEPGHSHALQRFLFDFLIGLALGKPVLEVSHRVLNLSMLKQLSAADAIGSLRFSQRFSSKQLAVAFDVEAVTLLVWGILTLQSFFFGAAAIAWTLAREHNNLARMAKPAGDGGTGVSNPGDTPSAASVAPPAGQRWITSKTGWAALILLIFFLAVAVFGLVRKLLAG